MTKYTIDESRKANHPSLGLTIRISDDETADVNWLTRESLERWLRSSEAVNPGFSVGMVCTMLGHDEPACGDGQSPGQRAGAAMLKLEEDGGPELDIFLTISAESLKFALDAMRHLGIKEYSHESLMATISLFANGAEQASWLKKYFDEDSEEGVSHVRDAVAKASGEVHS